MSKLIALVMAGGKGTRFWPESTARKPKQYLALLGEESLLTQTLKRFDSFIGQEDRFIVTVKEQEKLAQEYSAHHVGDQALIFEPSGRNTAPCILLAIVNLLKQGYGNEDVVAIVPSDHVILNAKGFQKTIQLAADVAKNDKAIVTIGITPNFPHTGFGYLHKGEETQTSVFKVAEFKEKPDVETAKMYLESGEYLWNAGMFVATLGCLIEEFKNCSPETYEYMDALMNAGDDCASVYEKIPANSIDYAIMEKSSRVKVVPAEFDWNDLGSWDALESVIEKKDKNTFASCRAHYLDNSEGNIVYAPGKHVSLVDVNNFIVVSNEQSVVILPKDKSQSVKNIVEALKADENLKDLL